MLRDTELQKMSGERLDPEMQRSRVHCPTGGLEVVFFATGPSLKMYIFPTLKFTKHDLTNINKCRENDGEFANLIGTTGYTSIYSHVIDMHQS